MPKRSKMPRAEKIFRVCPAIAVESNANGIESGSVNRIVTGWMNDSNCAARIRYINTNDKRNASRNELYARCSSFDWPVTPDEYSGGRLRSLTYEMSLFNASDSDALGGKLELIVTTRCRLSRPIEAG